MIAWRGLAGRCEMSRWKGGQVKKKKSDNTGNHEVPELAQSTRGMDIKPDRTLPRVSRKNQARKVVQDRVPGV